MNQNVYEKQKSDDEEISAPYSDSSDDDGTFSD